MMGRGEESAAKIVAGDIREFADIFENARTKLMQWRNNSWQIKKSLN